MVDRQLVPRGIRSQAVLDAMRAVPRHLFVPENLQVYAYADSPLPIGHEQTISQPYIVAYMTEVLEPCVGAGMRVLEIGTGSGYQAAVLAELGCEVYTVECVREHAERAMQLFSGELHESLRFRGSVSVRHGNGYDGWVEHAPFDAVVVTAAPESVPSALVSQLKDGGKMVLPVGEVHAVQSLMLLTKSGDGYITKDLLPVRFVPMVGG